MKQRFDVVFERLAVTGVSELRDHVFRMAETPEIIGVRIEGDVLKIMRVF